jgi:hypothetical protein
MNRLYIHYRRKRWDLVANGGEPDALAEFAKHYPGRRWEVRSPDGPVILAGRTPHEADPATLWRVTWEIDLEAATAREAAEKALEIHRRPTSIATVFEVYRLGHKNRRLGKVEKIDLTSDDEEGE